MNRVVGGLVASIAVLGLAAGPAGDTLQPNAACAVSGTPTAPASRLHNNPPPWPILLSPADGATMTQTPTFRWTPVRDPEGDSVNFQLQVDDNPDFSSPEIDTRGHAYATFTPERPLQSGHYCWRVRSIDDIEARSPYSAAFELTIRSSLASLTLKGVRES